MSRLLIITSWVCALLALGSVIWIVVPALSPYLWLYAVAVSEWGLWFALFALAGIVSALGNYFYFKNGFPFAVLIVCGVAFLLALYPFLSSLPAARELGRNSAALECAAR